MSRVMCYVSRVMCHDDCDDTRRWWGLTAPWAPPGRGSTSSSATRPPDPAATSSPATTTPAPPGQCSTVQCSTVQYSIILISYSINLNTHDIKSVSNSLYENIIFEPFPFPGKRFMLTVDGFFCKVLHSPTHCTVGSIAACRARSEECSLQAGLLLYYRAHVLLVQCLVQHLSTVTSLISCRHRCCISALNLFRDFAERREFYEY